MSRGFIGHVTTTVGDFVPVPVSVQRTGRLSADNQI